MRTLGRTVRIKFWRKEYQTLPETILQYEEDKESRLSRILWDEDYEYSHILEDGAFFINRCGDNFKHILNYLRNNKNPDYILKLELTEGEWFFMVEDCQFYDKVECECEC